MERRYVLISSTLLFVSDLSGSLDVQLPAHHVVGAVCCPRRQQAVIHRAERLFACVHPQKPRLAVAEIFSLLTLSPFARVLSGLAPLISLYTSRLPSQPAMLFAVVTLFATMAVTWGLPVHRRDGGLGNAFPFDPTQPNDCSPTGSTSDFVAIRIPASL
jgi:hypothetical protein